MIDTKEIEGRIERYRKRGDYEPIGSIAFECIDHIDAQAEENKCLREALEFYADKDTYKGVRHEEWVHGEIHSYSKHPVMEDDGKKARDAIKPSIEEAKT